MAKNFQENTKKSNQNMIFKKSPFVKEKVQKALGIKKSNKNRIFMGFLRRKIRFKIILFEIFIILFVAAALGFMINMNMNRILTEKTHQASERLITDLANSISTKYDSLSHSDEAIKQVQSIEGVLYAGYYGYIVTGTLQHVHLYIGKSPKTEYLQNLEAQFTNLMGFKKHSEVLKFDINGKKMAGFEYYAPVRIKEMGDKMIGYVILRFSKELIDRELRLVRQLILIITGIIIIISLIISIRGANSIVRPILELTRVVRKFGEGDLNQQISVKSVDEIGVLANTFNQMMVSVRQKLEMQKFVSGSTMKMIETTVMGKQTAISQEEQAGERAEVTLFFSDIRGFTSMSEKLDPKDVVTILNLYLDLQTSIIRQYDGDIDKFVGDEIVAVFEGEQMCERAVQAARAIQLRLMEINKKREDEGKLSVHVGIGINAGEVVLGSIGSSDRKDFTVIGDNVNTASRLCSAAGRDEIIISKSVYDRLPIKDQIIKQPPIKVKGKARELEVFKVEYS